MTDPHLDHLVYGVTDLESAVRELADGLGVAPVVGGRHDGRGTRNHLLGLGGDRYLEVIARDPDQPEPDRPRMFGVDDLTGPRLVTWAVRAPDIDERVDRARAAGVVVVDPEAMSRRTADGGVLRWRLAFTGDGIVPFLIDWGATPHPARGGMPAVELVSLSAVHPDPGLIRARLAAVGAELDVERGPRARLRAVLRGPGGSVELD